MLGGDVSEFFRLGREEVVISECDELLCGEWPAFGAELVTGVAVLLGELASWHVIVGFGVVSVASTGLEALLGGARSRGARGEAALLRTKRWALSAAGRPACGSSLEFLLLCSEHADGVID